MKYFRIKLKMGQKKFIHEYYEKGLLAIPINSGRQLQVGQTLLEILLAFSVSILVLSAVILGIITSLNNTQYTKNQGLANSYAQEGMAVVRQIRDSGWNNFYSLKDYTTNTKYCLGTNPMELRELTLPNQNCWVQSPVPVGGIFSRDVKFEHNSSSCCSDNSLNCSTGIKGSKTTVTVSWSDNKCSVGTPLCHKVELITCFSNTSFLGSNVPTPTPAPPTPTPTPISAKLVGADDVTGTGNNSGNYVFYDKWTAVASGNLIKIKIKAGVACNAKIAVYSDSAGTPGSKLNGLDVGIPLVVGWNTISFPSTSITSGTVYWLGSIFDSSYGIVYVGGAGVGTQYYKYISYSTFTWPASAGSGFSIYPGYNIIAGWNN